MLQFGSIRCPCVAPSHTTRLVAVTGGPGAGKTAILELARRSLCHHVCVLPEAASVVFGGGFPRRPSTMARCAAQRAIYHVQREVEGLVVADGTVGLALCDRGTLDGLAYWPGDHASFWRDVASTHAAELARYEAVVHLETPTGSNGYNHENPLRIESADEAREIDRRIGAIWADHPRRFHVESTTDFLSKVAHALDILRALNLPCCAAETPPS